MFEKSLTFGLCVCKLLNKILCLCRAVALPMVNNLELFDITHSTMRVRWRIAAGASGYMILYAPLTEGDPADEKEVSSLCVCFCQNNGITVKAVYPLCDSEQRCSLLSISDLDDGCIICAPHCSCGTDSVCIILHCRVGLTHPMPSLSLWWPNCLHQQCKISPVLYRPTCRLTCLIKVKSFLIHFMKASYLINLNSKSEFHRKITIRMSFYCQSKENYFRVVRYRKKKE